MREACSGGFGVSGADILFPDFVYNYTQHTTPPIDVNVALVERLLRCSIPDLYVSVLLRIASMDFYVCAIFDARAHAIIRCQKA